MKIDKDKLIDHIINWLNSNIDEFNLNYKTDKEFNADPKNYLAQDSADLKEKIELYLEGVDEFGE